MSQASALSEVGTFGGQCLLRMILLVTPIDEVKRVGHTEGEEVIEAAKDEVGVIPRDCVEERLDCFMPVRIAAVERAEHQW